MDRKFDKVRNIDLFFLRFAKGEEKADKGKQYYDILLKEVSEIVKDKIQGKIKEESNFQVIDNLILESYDENLKVFFGNQDCKREVGTPQYKYFIEFDKKDLSNKGKFGREVAVLEISDRADTYVGFGIYDRKILGIQYFDGIKEKDVNNFIYGTKKSLDYLKRSQEQKDELHSKYIKEGMGGRGSFFESSAMGLSSVLFGRSINPMGLVQVDLIKKAAKLRRKQL